MYRIISRSLSTRCDSLTQRSSSFLLSVSSRCRHLSTSSELEEDGPGDRNVRKKHVITAKFHEDFAEKLANEELKYRKHPGKRKSPCVWLPALHEMSAKRAVSKYLNNSFRERVVKHERSFHSIQLPDEPEDLQVKGALIREKVAKLYPVSNLMEPDEREFVMKKRQEKFDRDMKLTTKTWRQIEYDEETSAVYCASRFTANYAVLRWVLTDLAKLDVNFAPKTLFDFGSGLGTTMHVANEIWPGKINEHMNIDLSKPMIDLCDFILRNGDESRPQMYPGVYYREYLPLSSAIKYDLVVSAFTLLELPSRKARIEAIEALWQKTSDVLVIIESGSRAGFSCVLEARNLILQDAGYDVNKSFYELQPEARRLQPLDPYSLPSAYIEGPCPHHFACPRLFTGGPILCNFPVSYIPFDIGIGSRDIKHDFFSYVILRKGKKTLQGKSIWPRVNQRVLKKNRFAICRMCCPDGSIKELTVTKKKHRGDMYKMVRRADWGDILPIVVHEVEKDMHRWDLIKEQNRNMRDSDHQDDSDDSSDEEEDDETHR